jgi:hypothetical protein
MYRVYTLEGLASGSMVQLSFTMLTLGVASLLALLLGTLGLYGVLSPSWRSASKRSAFAWPSARRHGGSAGWWSRGASGSS